MNLVRSLLVFAATLAGFWTTQAAAPDIVIADFESSTYGSWQSTGEAFGPGPAKGTLPNQMPVDGFLGTGLVNSFYKGDAATGTLTSPPFRIERPRIQFLIGGGNHPNETCLNLVVDGRLVRTATGPNDRPGGTEHLDWNEWDVNDLAGQTARIEIVDRATGGWGHINVDQIVQTERRLPAWQTPAEREIVLEQRYLNFPVKNGAPSRRVRLLQNGQPVREFGIELADGAPDFWVFTDMQSFRGHKISVQVDRLREDSAGLSSISQSSEIPGADSLYAEPLRPQFHFSSQRGWNNDPNGLVYLDGEYHLFYQHNPYGWSWGNMHWGHAVSPDLVHWRELGEALYPDALGTMFSGSAVVDRNNTAGFARPGETALVCIYTAAGGTSPESKGQRFSQCIAYSTDRGRTWTKYRGNPVLPHIAAENRDPKVFWYEPGKHWVMALYLDKSDFALFSSPDLKNWQRLSDVNIPGTSECPEFFQIPLVGEPQETRWVFYGGNGRYLVGRFDGKQFVTESGPHTLNYGNCFYASQTYNDLPAADGRRILVAWGQINLPGMPFNQLMDFPVELSLHRTQRGLRLSAVPAREIERLPQSTRPLQPQTLRTDAWTQPLDGELFDISLDLDPGNAQAIELSVRGVVLTYDVAKRQVRCLDKQGPLEPADGRIRLRMLVDRPSIEIFGNDGSLYMPMGTIVDKANRSLSLRALGGEARLTAGTVRRLQSIWPSK